MPSTGHALLCDGQHTATGSVVRLLLLLRLPACLLLGRGRCCHSAVYCYALLFAPPHAAAASCHACRDVKPENLLAASPHSTSPEALHLTLIDFGSAVDRHTLTKLYGKAGPSADELTLEYAPPECLFGDYWKVRGGLRCCSGAWQQCMIRLSSVVVLLQRCGHCAALGDTAMLPASLAMPHVALHC
jgi:hypothetical protein